MLALDDECAAVARRIFGEYLDGLGDRATANGLNRDGIACPSMNRPEENRHRLADGWQGSIVRSILENPRHTRYVFFGRWTKKETLLDPDDVAAGHVVRSRRSAPERVVRSRTQAHPEIVSVEMFTQAQLLRRAKSAGGFATARKSERRASGVARTYLLRRRVRCVACGRKMRGETVRESAYYRCAARTIAPGSPQLADHPKTVNLREDTVVSDINVWLMRVFAPENVDTTVAGLLDVRSLPDAGAGTATARKRLAHTDARLRRYQAATGSARRPGRAGGRDPPGSS
ncbi:recombinase family protein [Amycolatopsis sp. GM8]|uniref:recombinase family protein n=1 Tax=Amycolatopsis sp. GM8 TaxID=2896530 RepID=UPI001F32B644|nr:recombinase family protein [Amycolatopsis sp. GM8]